MKRFLFNLLIFFAYFLIIALIIENIFKQLTPKEDRYAWQYQELFDPKVKADIVIFGSSKSARGISPKILESDSIRVFNFGLNGSNPKFTHYWYNNLFKKYYPKPKLILLEISWMMLDTSRMWRVIEQDSRYLPPSDFFYLFLNSENKHTAFFNRYHVFNRTVGSGGAMDLTYNGYTPSLEIVKKISTLDSLKFKPNQVQMNYFNSLLNNFKKDNIKVGLVILPENLSKNVLRTGTTSKCMNDLKIIAARYRIEVLDYQHYFESNADSVFRDWGHLNIKGAELITTKIKKDIISRIDQDIYTNAEKTILSPREQ